MEKKKKICKRDVEALMRYHMIIFCQIKRMYRTIVARLDIDLQLQEIQLF
jgi:hypothetical protein